MPSFFTFQTGDSTRATNDSSPLLGRFRAVPNAHRNSLLGRRRSILGVGYGSVFGAIGGAESDDSEDEDGNRGWRRWGRLMRDLWVEPKQGAVARAVERWWWRWVVLVVMPDALVSFAVRVVWEG
jgi:hypothetical protein